MRKEVVVVVSRAKHVKKSQKKREHRLTVKKRKALLDNLYLYLLPILRIYGGQINENEAIIIRFPFYIAHCNTFQNAPNHLELLSIRMKKNFSKGSCETCSSNSNHHHNPCFICSQPKREKSSSILTTTLLTFPRYIGTYVLYQQKSLLLARDFFYFLLAPYSIL